MPFCSYFPVTSFDSARYASATLLLGAESTTGRFASVALGTRREYGHETARTVECLIQTVSVLWTQTAPPPAKRYANQALHGNAL